MQIIGRVNQFNVIIVLQYKQLPLCKINIIINDILNIYMYIGDGIRL